MFSYYVVLPQVQNNQTSNDEALKRAINKLLTAILKCGVLTGFNLFPLKRFLVWEFQKDSQ